MHKNVQNWIAIGKTDFTKETPTSSTKYSADIQYTVKVTHSKSLLKVALGYMTKLTLLNSNTRSPQKSLLQYHLIEFIFE